MCLDLTKFTLNKPSIQYRAFPTGYCVFQQSLYICFEWIFKQIPPSMTKNQVLGRLVIQRLRLNPMLQWREGNKSLLRSARTNTCHRGQPKNYPRQYLRCGEEIFPAPVGPIATRGANHSPIGFSPLWSPKEPQDRQTIQLQRTSGAGRPTPILFQGLKTTAVRNSPSAKFRREQAHTCVSLGKRLISFFFL